MKKALVLAAVVFCIIGLFFLSGTLVSRAENRPAESSNLERKTLSVFGGRGADGYAYDSPAPPPSAAPAPDMDEARSENDFAGLVGGAADKAAGPGGGLGMARPARSFEMKEKKVAAKPLAMAASAEPEAPPAATRAWFPETFLFEPLVVTDAQGRATVPVKVPDRLTTWRVLALAHSRQGGQAGAVTSFLGTLPTYVEPVVPPMLYAGDSVVIPVQVVNTTDRDVTSSLTLSSTGVLASKGGSVKVQAGGSVVQNVGLKAPTPGKLSLKAVLGSTDAIERIIDVRPAGQRETVTHGGTLAAPRSFSLTGPAKALPNSEQVVLRVFPGALGLVRAELSAAPGRGGVAEDAYLLQLLGDAPRLLAALGGEADPVVIRELSVISTQRAMRHGRAPGVDAATLLAEAALTHPQNPVLERLGERLVAQVARAQRPDGTCSGADGWTLQRLLVTTGDCLRAIRAGQRLPRGEQRYLGASVKAAGAFERNLGRINDPYTAAAALASGVVTGTVAEKLRAIVLAGITSSAEGAAISVPSGVVRADGLVPSTIEATALAVLALENEPKAPLADLGTTLLGAYDPYTGWGDGRTNLLALRAVTTLFKEKVPEGVTIVLARDGVELAKGVLSAEALKNVLVLDAEATGSSGDHMWTVTATPPVPGLGYALGLTAYVPWKESETRGIELTSTVPDALQVGKPAALELTASFPSGTPMKLRLGLPAGVQHDTPSLDALVSSKTITRYETEDGAITLHLADVAAGSTWSGRVQVIPTLAGTLQAQPTSLALEYQANRSKTFVPKAWVIRN